MSDSAGEKTEKPTAKKNTENRNEGQVPRTQALGGWASMMVVALALPPLLGRELSALIDLPRGALHVAEHPTVPVPLAILREGRRHPSLPPRPLAAARMRMRLLRTPAP